MSIPNYLRGGTKLCCTQLETWKIYIVRFQWFPSIFKENWMTQLNTIWILWKLSIVTKNLGVEVGDWVTTQPEILRNAEHIQNSNRSTNSRTFDKDFKINVSSSQKFEFSNEIVNYPALSALWEMEGGARTTWMLGKAKS